MNYPLISVIIPCYDAQKTIGRSIDSLHKQTYRNWEAVIISDDLTDYRHVLDLQGLADERIRFATTSQRAAGPSYARNIGLDEAQGDFIVALDSDDAYCPARLEKLITLATSYGAAHSNVLLRHTTGEDIGYLIGHSHSVSSLSLEALIHMSIASHPMFEKGLGEWDNELCYGEIAKLNFQLHDVLGEIPVDPSTHYIYYDTANSLINRPASVSYVQEHRERELKKSAINIGNFLNDHVHVGYMRSIIYKISIRETCERAYYSGSFKEYLKAKELLDIGMHLKPLRKIDGSITRRTALDFFALS